MQHAPDFRFIMSLVPGRTYASVSARHARLLDRHEPNRKKGKYVRIKYSKLIGYKCVHSMMNKVIANVVHKASSRSFYHASSTRQKQNHRRWVATNRVKNRKLNMDYHNRHRDRRVQLMRVYYAEVNKEHALALLKERQKNDPGLHMLVRLRSRLRSYAKRRDRDLREGHHMDSLGCSSLFLRNHIASQTTEHLSMQSTHLDHIFPCVLYNPEVSGWQRKCFHYSNIQPLSAKENRNKYVKLPTKAMAAKVDRDKWPPGITEDMLPDIYPGWSTPLRM